MRRNRTTEQQACERPIERNEIDIIGLEVTDCEFIDGSFLLILDNGNQRVRFSANTGELTVEKIEIHERIVSVEDEVVSRVSKIRRRGK